MTKSTDTTATRAPQLVDSLRDALSAQQRVLAVIRDSLAAMSTRIATNTIAEKKQDSLSSLALAAQLVKARADSVKTFRDLHIATVSKWSGSTVGLATGLHTASAIGSLGNAVLIFRQEDATSLSSLLDDVGRGAVALGAALSGTGAGNGNNSQLKSGLYTSSLGFLLHSGVDFVRNYGSHQNETLRLYTERVALNQDLSAQVESIQAAITALLPSFDTLSTIATPVATSNDPNDAANFKLTHTLVQRYEASVDAYTALTSQLSQANTLATTLGKQAWTTSIQTDLTRIAKTTADALAVWKVQLTVSKGLLRSMQTLADIDDPKAPLAAKPE